LQVVKSDPGYPNPTATAPQKSVSATTDAEEHVEDAGTLESSKSDDLPFGIGLLKTLHYDTWSDDFIPLPSNMIFTTSTTLLDDSTGASLLRDFPSIIKKFLFAEGVIFVVSKFCL
jgi:hypothetical protein